MQQARGAPALILCLPGPHSGVLTPGPRESQNTVMAGCLGTTYMGCVVRIILAPPTVGLMNNPEIWTSPRPFLLSKPGCGPVSPNGGLSHSPLMVCFTLC